MISVIFICALFQHLYFGSNRFFCTRYICMWGGQGCVQSYLAGSVWGNTSLLPATSLCAALYFLWWCPESSMCSRRRRHIIGNVLHHEHEAWNHGWYEYVDPRIEKELDLVIFAGSQSLSHSSLSDLSRQQLEARCNTRTWFQATFPILCTYF